MRALRRLWPLLVILAAFAALQATGPLFWRAIGQHELALRRTVAAHPVLGAAAYVGSYAVLVGLSLPSGGVMTIAGGLLFGAAGGAALAVCGATAGAVLLFLWVRRAASGSLARRAAPWVEPLRPGLNRDGFSYLLALRLMPVVPFWLSNIAPALLGMRFGPYALATLIGIMPATAVLAAFGAGLGREIATGASPDAGMLLHPWVLLPLFGLGLLALLPIAWRRWRERHA